MKKILSLALVALTLFAFAIPVLTLGSAGFISGTVVSIDKSGYDNFKGTELTANNNNADFGGFSFIADNKILNAWYINVADDIIGSLEVAYKVGNQYYVVSFDIDGVGKYWIADSRSGSGVNMVKVGAFADHIHDWGEWVVTTEARCLSDGEETRVCKINSSHAETRPIPATGHNNDGYDLVTPATCEQNGFGWIFCTGCGRCIPDIIPMLGHDYVSTFETKGIVEEDGARGVRYECSRCDDYYIRTTEIKTGILVFYSNADGVNTDYVYYRPDDDSPWRSTMWHAYRFFDNPTGFSEEDGFFTGSISGQFIWTTPQDEVNIGDNAVFEFTYELPEALRREVIYYPRLGTRELSTVGCWLYLYNDCDFELWLNDDLHSSTQMFKDQHPGSALPEMYYGNDFNTTFLFSKTVADTSVNTLTLKIVAKNILGSVNNETEKAVILFAGAAAYEYEIFAAPER